MASDDTTPLVLEPELAMMATIEQSFKATANVVIKEALKVMDATGLQDPKCLAVLKVASSQLPAHYASVAEAKSKLDDLLKLSEQFQQASLDLSASLAKKDDATAEIRRMIISQEEAIKVMSQAMATTEARETDLMNQLTEIQKKFAAVKSEKEQLFGAYNAQDLELQKLKGSVQGEYDQEINDLKAKVSCLEGDAKKLRADLENWCS